MSPGPRVASGRASLATYVAGRGDSVVFLHANVCNSRMWRAQMDALAAADLKAIAYDRRGFGETTAEREDHSALADLLAVLDATAEGRPAILVGCSLGGRIALDATLRHPSRVRALVLIAPNVTGAPDPTYSPEIAALVAHVKEAEAARDLDRVNALKARFWLDGPLASEGRVARSARNLFFDMNGIALRSLPVGPDVDVLPIYHRLRELAVPCLVAWGDLDFPYVQDRCRHVAAAVPGGSRLELKDTAHLPSLDRPDEVTALLAAFIKRVRLASDASL